jgi:hypothetical protein
MCKKFGALLINFLLRNRPTTCGSAEDDIDYPVTDTAAFRTRNPGDPLALLSCRPRVPLRMILPGQSRPLTRWTLSPRIAGVSTSELKRSRTS